MLCFVLATPPPEMLAAAQELNKTTLLCGNVITSVLRLCTWSRSNQTSIESSGDRGMGNNNTPILSMTQTQDFRILCTCFGSQNFWRSKEPLIDWNGGTYPLNTAKNNLIQKHRLFFVDDCSLCSAPQFNANGFKQFCKCRCHGKLHFYWQRYV